MNLKDIVSILSELSWLRPSELLACCSLADPVIAFAQKMCKNKPAVSARIQDGAIKTDNEGISEIHNVIVSAYRGLNIEEPKNIEEAFLLQQELGEQYFRLPTTGEQATREQRIKIRNLAPGRYSFRPPDGINANSREISCETVFQDRKGKYWIKTPSKAARKLKRKARENYCDKERLPLRWSTPIVEPPMNNTQSKTVSTS